MTVSTNEKVASRLQGALKHARMTGKQLAKRIKVTPGAVSHWLTGRRAAPPEILDKIADVLGVDRGWLRGMNEPKAVSAPEKEQKKMAKKTVGRDEDREDAAWRFREAPEDGGKDFGNANIWATPPDISTLVRETGQNSLDASVGQEVHMRYRLIELTKGSDAYRGFLDALKFKDLQQHISAASSTRSKLGVRLRAGLERLRSESRLVLLRIDDYGTLGLQGGESESEKPFAALVRDNLNSAKQTAMAGGAFGLGKAVLWRCSTLSTVLFASRVKGEEKNGTRISGKTELTWHNHTPPCAGPGWFGRPAKGAPSIWTEDEDFLRALHLGRSPLPTGVEEDGSTGTSILIVGFLDPRGDTGSNTADAIGEIARAAAFNFWPAMLWGELAVSVERYVNDAATPEQLIVVDPRNYVPAFCAAVESQMEKKTVTELSQPGDVVEAPVSHTVPATRSGDDVEQYPEAVAQSVLVVRQSETTEPADDRYLNHVAMIRGRGMVTFYWPRAGIVVGGKPFHGVLLAAQAADQGQAAAEQFLRLAEPPAHDDWSWNDDLREKYQRGAKLRLNELYDATTATLQGLLKPSVSSTDETPEILRQLLRLTIKAPPEPTPAILRKVKSALVKGSWNVEAEVYVNDPTKSWKVTPRLSFDTETGARIPVEWAETKLLDGSVTIEDGAFVVPARVRRFVFSGRSDPTSHPVDPSRCRAKIDLAIRKVK